MQVKRDYFVETKKNLAHALSVHLKSFGYVVFSLSCVMVMLMPFIFLSESFDLKDALVILAFTIALMISIGMERFDEPYQQRKRLSYSLGKFAWSGISMALVMLVYVFVVGFFLMAWVRFAGLPLIIADSIMTLAYITAPVVMEALVTGRRNVKRGYLPMHLHLYDALTATKNSLQEKANTRSKELQEKLDKYSGSDRSRGD